MERGATVTSCVCGQDWPCLLRNHTGHRLAPILETVTVPRMEAIAAEFLRQLDAWLPPTAVDYVIATLGEFNRSRRGLG